MRNEFLTERVRNLFQRYSPPRSIAKNPQAQAEELDGVIRAIGASMPASGYEDWWQDFEDRLLSNHQTRSWPTIYEIRQALAAGRKADPAMAAARFEASILDWCAKHKRPHPAANTPEITRELISRGHLDDIRDARWRGFELTSDDAQRAIDMPAGRDEWNHHVNWMAAHHGMSFSEAEAREVAEFKNRNQLPKHLQRAQPAVEAF